MSNQKFYHSGEWFGSVSVKRYCQIDAPYDVVFQYGTRNSHNHIEGIIMEGAQLLETLNGN